MLSLPETPTKPSSPHCAALSSPSYANFGLSLFIVLGILVSYLPQHYRIISRRSSSGISPYFILLGTTSGTSALANIIVLPTSRADLACCKELSGLECFAGLLGILQVGIQWACFTLILLLFLAFFPRATAPHTPKDAPSFRTAILVTIICVTHAVLTAILNTVFLYLYPQHLQSWANFLGIFATLLAVTQYLPQLYTTWRLQTVGSLSISMMLIQTPGSFVWAGSLAARLGWEGWSSWGTYTATGCLQGCVLVTGIWVELKERKRKKEGVHDENEDGNDHFGGDEPGDYQQVNPRTRNEETPLLENQD